MDQYEMADRVQMMRFELMEKNLSEISILEIQNKKQQPMAARKKK